jgi:hypothetical protein
MTAAETATRTSVEARLTVLLDSDDPGPALRALGAPADREWRRDANGYSGFEFFSSLGEAASASEHAEELIQRLRRLGPALREIGRHPQTHSIRLTVAERTQSESATVSLAAASISLLSAIGAELVAEISR